MSFIALFSAFWLGVLTAISPCPLASNIAAISFIGRLVGDKKKVFISGILYITGRSLAYIAIGAAITAGLTTSGALSRFLQTYLVEFVGPLLILLGMVLLGMIGSRVSFNLGADKLQSQAEKYGAWFALPLGVVFALSFCPVSAGLFFAALVPLALKTKSIFILPASYGVGTALPVIFFAFLIAFGGEILGKAFNRLTQVELWIRRVTGVLFIAAGIYMTLTHVYDLKLM